MPTRLYRVPTRLHAVPTCRNVHVPTSARRPRNRTRIGIRIRIRIRIRTRIRARIRFPVRFLDRASSPDPESPSPLRRYSQVAFATRLRNSQLAFATLNSPSQLSTRLRNSQLALAFPFATRPHPRPRLPPRNSPPPPWCPPTLLFVSPSGLLIPPLEVSATSPSGTPVAVACRHAFTSSLASDHSSCH